MTFVMKISQDLRLGARHLWKHPNYSVTMLLTLVLTIAAVTIMFSLVSHVILKPLPLPDADRLVAIEIRNTQTGAGERSESIPFAMFEDWQAAKPDDFEIAWAVIESSVLTEAEIGVYSAGHFVSHNFLAMIGIEPLLGRWFTEEDAGEPVLAISYDMWQQDLAGDRNIIGRSISVDKMPFTVIGVMPQDFLKSLEPRIRYWRPIDAFGRGGAVLGRLPAGTTAGYVQSLYGPFDRILQRDSAQYAVSFVPLQDQLVGPARPNLWLLAGAVAALFLVAILNLTNLAFAHLYSRIHELTTRAALGAARIRLVRQLIVENLILAVIAAAASIAVAAWLLEFALSIMPEAFPRKSEIELDKWVWLFSLLMSIGSAALVTLIPGLRIANPARLVAHMKHGSNRLVSGFGSIRLRRYLIAGQVCVALTLLVAVGLLMRSYVKLLEQEMGFSPERVVSGHIWRPDGFSDEEISLAFERVLDEIEKLPEVSLVAAGSTIPMGPISTRVDPSIGYSFLGQPALGEGEESRVAVRTVTDGFFTVLGIRLVAGRFFDGREETSDNPTLVINEAMADAVWPGEDAIGRELILERRGGDAAFTIVGVVENYKFEGLYADIKPEIFLSMSQQVFGGATYIAKIRSDDAEAAMESIARIASRLDSSMPMIELRTMDELVRDSISGQQAVLSILLGFSIFAMLLAAVGIYGLTSYLIGCRTREIAIRIALGAKRSSIRKWVIKDALIPAGLGIFIGSALTVPLSMALGSFLFGVETWDWPAYAGALCIVVLVATFAPVGPALRAARIQPNHALRDQ